MRRTDEAFKNELFRRYGQYKKNRRNLRILAAAPGAVSLVLICALLIVPNLDLWQSLEPAGNQINDVNPSKDPGDNDTPSIGANVPDLEEPDSNPLRPNIDISGIAPSLPFYEAFVALRNLSITPQDVIFAAPSLSSPQLSHTAADNNEMDAIIDALEAILKGKVTEVEHSTVTKLDALTYTLSFTGASTLQFQIKDGKYLRSSDPKWGTWDDWCEVDPALVKQLTDLFDPNIFESDYAPTLPQAPLATVFDGTAPRYINVIKGDQRIFIYDTDWHARLQDAMLAMRFDTVSYDEASKYTGGERYTLYFNSHQIEFNGTYYRVDDGFWLAGEAAEMNNVPMAIVCDMLEDALSGETYHKTVRETAKALFDLEYDYDVYNIDAALYLGNPNALQGIITDAATIANTIEQLEALLQTIEGAGIPDEDLPADQPIYYSLSPHLNVHDGDASMTTYIIQFRKDGYLRYAGGERLNRFSTTDWYKVDASKAQALTALVEAYCTPLETLESFGIDAPPSTAPAGTTPSEAFDLLETFAPDRIEAAISSYYENSRTITDKAEIGSIVELLKNLVRGVGIELADIVDEPGGKHRYTIRLQNDAEGLDFTFEFVEPYIRIINGENVGDWYKVDITVTGAESLFPALGVNLDHSDQLFKTLYGGLVMLNQIDVHTITATWSEKATISYQKELLSLSYGDDPATKQAIIDALETILNGVGEEADEGYVTSLNTYQLIIDLSGNPSPEYPGQNYDTWVREYTIVIANGYLCYTGYTEPTGESGQSGWYAIDSDAQNSLLELIESARPSVTPPESSVQPISPVPNPLTPLFTENKLSSITVQNDLSLSATLGSDDAELIARIGDTLTSLVCYDSSQVDVDAISRLRPYKLKLTFADGNTAEIDFRSEFFFFDGAWYFIDSTDWQVLEVLLQAAYNTRGPLSEWTIDSYALTQAETHVWANNALQKSITVTDAGLLQEIGDLLLKFNEHAFLPNNTTLAWLIENEPAKFANSPALYYVVELVTQKAYAFVLYDRYLYANGVWWEIVPADYTAYFEEYLCLLESYLCGDLSTSATDKLFGDAKITEIVVNTKVAGNYNVISDADRVKQITTAINVDYTTNGQYCTGSASFLSWNDEGEAKLTRILDFLRTLKLTPADDQSLTGEQLHVYFTYLHNSFYTFNLCGRTLNIDGHGTYQISESDAVTLHALLTDSEGFDAASNPIKPLLVGAEIQTMSAARYYSSEEATITEAKDSGAYILAMTELLSSLTLSDTARQPLTADTLDLTVNFTCTTDRDSDIHNQLAFQLHNGRYLYLQVTPGASYWYEIPTAEGEALISLVEGMR